MDRGDDRYPKPLDRIEKHLSVTTQPLGIRRRLELLKLLDVGAGNPYIRFAADQHRGVHRGVPLHPTHQRHELVLDGATELVDGLVGQIERDHRDPVSHVDRKRGLPSGPDQPADGDFRCGAHRVLSTTIAKPIPPAAQTVISPNCPPRRRSSLRSVVVMRAPVAPKGCPSAIDPPITLSLALSTSPTGCENPARSAHHFDSKPLRFERTWAANASCISTRSMSFKVSPARLSATGAARTGACSSCSPGSSAAYAYDLMIPSTGYPSDFAFSSFMRSTHAPPSVSGEELPAVTVPYFLSNTGFSAASCS